MAVSEEEPLTRPSADRVVRPRRASKHRLVDQTRRLIKLVALLDVEGTTPEEMAQLTAVLGTINDEVEKMPSLSAKGGPIPAGGEDAEMLERSGVSGRSNPLAAPIRYWEVDGQLHGTAVYTDAYEGPSGAVHGGFVVAAFDELLGAVQRLSGTPGPTGTIKVRLHKPTPINRPIDYQAGIDRVEGRKIFCWGRSWHGDELVSEAEIVFIARQAVWTDAG